VRSGIDSSEGNDMQGRKKIEKNNNCTNVKDTILSDAA
jgi:hypothetical protein